LGDLVWGGRDVRALHVGINKRAFTEAVHVEFISRKGAKAQRRQQAISMFETGDK
jgi:hypothetical protein